MATVEFDSDVIHGVETFLNSYVHAASDEDYVIAYAPDSRDSAVWITAGLKARGVSPRLVMMRPLVDDEFEGRLRAMLPDPASVSNRLVVITLERDTMSHFAPLKAVWDAFGSNRCQIVRVISASREFFTEAVRITPEDLTRRNATLLSMFSGRHRLAVYTDGGTHLDITVDEDRYDWISNRGVWRPGGFTILPAGEIATYPVSIDGILVADGAVNCNIISRLDMRLADAPLYVTVENNEAVDFRCANREIHDLVEMCFARPYGSHVGELGFGTNVGITRFITQNSHINERRAGVHLGFGQHNQGRSRVTYVADIHLDLITNGAIITVDGGANTVDLEQLSPLDVPHPVKVRDEDIVEDCCGFGYGQLRANCAVPTEDRAGA